MQLYKYAHPNDVLVDLRKQLEQVTEVSFRDALFHPKYSRATVINIFQVFFHEMTAISIIKIHSTTLFEGMESSTFSVRFGTMLIGIINFVGTLISFVTV